MKLLNWFEKNKTITVIVIIASFLRLYHLNFQSIWIDELLTMNESHPKLSFKEANDLILIQEGTPRFYFFFVKIFNFLFGNTVYNARLVSVFFGILSVLFIYKLGKKLFTKNTGLFSAVFLTFNLFLIEYSQEARSYSMLVFFVILAFYCLILFINDRNYKNTFFLGISLGLITNAHPFGLLNVATIYLILLYILFIEKESKVDLFKKIFLSGLIFILIFLPVIPTILFVSGFSSFWIPNPTPEYLFQIFDQLLGGSLIFTFLFIVVYFVFVFKSTKLIRKESEEKNKYLLGFIIINVWIWFEVAVILLKSYFGISIALHRYFIAIVPAFILIIAVTIDFIKNNILKQFVVIVIVTYLIIDIFLIKDFYSVTRKSQFDKVTNFVIEKNTDRHKIVSSLGWLLGYYINTETSGKEVTEMTFDDYLIAVKNNAVKMESFWYIDGNSHPFNITSENQIFLDQNFVLDADLNNYYDAWAKHYVLKTEQLNNNPKSVTSNPITHLYLNEFNPHTLDGNGNLVMFENGMIESKQIELEKGKYQLVINGNSLPEKPIKNTNAHVIIKINNKEINKYFLSEKAARKTKKLNFEVENKEITKIQIVFDNDFSVDGLDRNVIIYSVEVIRVKS